MPYEGWVGWGLLMSEWLTTLDLPSCGPRCPHGAPCAQVYTHFPSGVVVPQTGSLGLLDSGDAFAWRIDTRFPHVNRSEVRAPLGLWFFAEG